MNIDTNIPDELKSLSREDLLHAAVMEQDKIKKAHPAMYFIPNIGQERCFDLYREHVPHITVFGAGNGVGKTTTMAIIAVGLGFGTNELHDCFQDHEIFKWAAEREKVKGRPGRYRIVCDAESVKPGGPVYQALEDWLPHGRYKFNKHGKTYVSEIECDTGVSFQIRTNDQEITAHAGSNLDGILFDEPPNEKIYGENVARTRDGGFMAFFLTPLDVAGWMLAQIIEAEDGKDVCIVNASIWDNCADIPGTRGHLTRENIQKMINQWERLSPDELEARINGTFTHLSGAIWKIFNPEVHVCKSFQVPRIWPVTMVIDPHDVKCPAVAWFADGPNKTYVIDEWPNTDYTKMKTSELTTDMVCEALWGKEQFFHGQILWRYMDPNKASYRYPHKSQIVTMQQEFARRGFRCMVSEDNIEVGHQRVNELLHYNPTREISEYNHPTLQVFDHCINMRNALQKYAIRPKFNPLARTLTSKLDPKYKDFADVIRYYAVKRHKYKAIGAGDGFWETIKSGRTKHY